MKFPKEIKGLEEKINRFTRLQTELGANELNEKINDIESYLNKEIQELNNLEINSERYNEPSDYPSILKASKSSNGITKIDDETYISKLKGAIYGRFAGCALGAPVELLSIGELKAFAKALDFSYPPEYYWPKAPNGYFPRYKVGKGNDFTSESMTFLSTDDDIAYTFLSLLIMEENGLDFKTEDVAKSWIKYLPRECTFTAERETLDNLNNNIDPLIAGEVNNPDTEFIGASIRCDGWAYVNPGNPLKASEFAHRDSYLSHRRSGIYSSMYFAAVISLAFVSKDIEKTLFEALDYIPENTEFYRQINWALKHSGNVTNYEIANQLVTERFPGMSWVHAINNACLTVWGILLGKDDFNKGITETVAMAYDNDCTAATVGSVLGAYFGIEKVDKKWYSRWNDRALSYLHGINEFSIEDVIKRYIKLGQK